MGIISILSLIISFALLDKPCSYMNWLENVFIGIFSSSLLCLITSCTGYISEEKKSVYSFYWNLSKLKSRALVLSTISDQSKNINSYYNAVYNMNELFRNEFALFDQNFIFIRRKKIQKVLEIYNALFEYKNSSTVAEQKMREFLACKKNKMVPQTILPKNFKMIFLIFIIKQIILTIPMNHLSFISKSK